jgi:hypothetical protein
MAFLLCFFLVTISMAIHITTLIVTILTVTYITEKKGHSYYDADCYNTDCHQKKTEKIVTISVVIWMAFLLCYIGDSQYCNNQRRNMNGLSSLNREESPFILWRWLLQYWLSPKKNREERPFILRRWLLQYWLSPIKQRRKAIHITTLIDMNGLSSLLYRWQSVL